MALTHLAKPLGTEFVRFGVTGVMAIMLNNAIIIGLTEMLHIHYLWSIITCFIITTAFGFIMNRYWSFGKTGKAQSGEAARYTTLSLTGVGLTLAGSWLLEQMGLPYYIATIGIALLLAPINFILHRGWSFGLSLPQQGQP